ncbi:MAG: hypothetical protein CMK50_03080 [Propionibacteriaceae bacterium]|nr:hypothetical protein [Propionibacteriaceae bacterium]
MASLWQLISYSGRLAMLVDQAQREGRLREISLVMPKRVCLMPVTSFDVFPGRSFALMISREPEHDGPGWSSFADFYQQRWEQFSDAPLSDAPLFDVSIALCQSGEPDYLAAAKSDHELRPGQAPSVQSTIQVIAAKSMSVRDWSR